MGGILTEYKPTFHWIEFQHQFPVFKQKTPAVKAGNARRRLGCV